MKCAQMWHPLSFSFSSNPNVNNITKQLDDGLFQRKRLWLERRSIIAWWLKLQYNHRTNRRSYTIAFAQVLYKLVVISTKKFNTLKIRFLAPLVWKNTSYTQQKIRHVLIFWGLHLFYQAIVSYDLYFPCLL